MSIWNHFVHRVRCVNASIIFSVLAGLLLNVILCVACCVAQDTLSDLPSGVASTTGFEDPYVSYRPAFAMNGFDCTRHGASCDHGLGLKQIIEHNKQPALVRALFELADEPLDIPDTRRLVARNSQRAQALGFTVLVALILEQNGSNVESALGIQSTLSATDRLEAMQALINDLDVISIKEDLPEERNTDDAVKWVGTLGNTTRFVDQYLALEQAFIHYGIAPGELFSCETKSAVLNHLEQQFRLVDSMGNRAVFELDFLEKVGLPVNILGADYDEVQAGNWSMKVHATVGYAALAQQFPEDGSCSSFTPEEEELYTHRIERAFRSAGPNDNPKRKHHWAFQTASGQRFWAEGPFYFNYGLASVIPFWQVVRAQGIEDFEYEDPFESDWFLEPLRGYADQVGPNGSVPPLEDGNKIPLEAAFMLRWNAAYSSDPELGQRFAWIAAAQKELPGEDNWLNILALPTTDEMQPPPALVAPDAGTHQIIVRRDGGTGSCAQLPEERTSPCHYVLVNGEAGKAIEAGEGHEQSDQLQLLYYVDDVSFLSDAGYDNAPGIENSSWNTYRHHNVMTIYNEGVDLGHGGLPGPRVGFECPIVAPCEVGMFANHAPVTAWDYKRYGNIDVLHGAVMLSPDAGLGESVREVAYERTVLFVDGTPPYLIDVNGVTPVAGNDPGMEMARVTMQYYVNADTEGYNGGETIRNIWDAPAAFGALPERSSHAFFIKQFAVEGEDRQEAVEDAVRETVVRGLSRGEGVPVLRLEQTNASPLSSFTTLAFMQPRMASGEGDVSCMGTHVDAVAGSEDASSGLYVWQTTPSAIDLTLVRAAATPLNEVLEHELRLGHAFDLNDWTVAKAYNTAGISIDYAGQNVVLDAGHRVGLVRLVKENATNTCLPLSTRETPGVPFYIGANFPNPVRNATSIALTLPQPAHVRMDVYDMLGRYVTTLNDRWLSSGKHEIQWEAGDIPAGTYNLRVQVGEYVESRQIAVL